MATLKIDRDDLLPQILAKLEEDEAKIGATAMPPPPLPGPGKKRVALGQTPPATPETKTGAKSDPASDLKETRAAAATSSAPSSASVRLTIAKRLAGERSCTHLPVSTSRLLRNGDELSDSADAR